MMTARDLFYKTFKRDSYGKIQLLNSSGFIINYYDSMTKIIDNYNLFIVLYDYNENNTEFISDSELSLIKGQVIRKCSDSEYEGWFNGEYVDKSLNELSIGLVPSNFVELKNKSTIPITHPEMTRFMITLEQATELVWQAFEDMVGGEIYVKKIPSMKITDIATAIAPEASHNVIGIRPGEKIHEQMISAEDALYTYEYDQYFKILPALHGWDKDKLRIKDGKKVDDNFSYTSDNNNEWMAGVDLRKWLTENEKNFGTF